MRDLPLGPVAAVVVAALSVPGEAMAAVQDYQPFDASAASSAQVSAPLFVALAYGAIWLLLLLFLVSIWLRQRGVAREVEEIGRRLGVKPGSGPA